MTNSREHSQEELPRQILAETIARAPESISTAADIEHRHNAPIQAALPTEASDYEWKRETGEVQSYQHTHAGSWLHIDPQGQFYDRQAQPITREAALEHAGQASAYSIGDNANAQSEQQRHHRAWPQSVNRMDRWQHRPTILVNQLTADFLLAAAPTEPTGKRSLREHDPGRGGAEDALRPS